MCTIGVSLDFDVPELTGAYTVSESAGNLRVCVAADGVINSAFDASLGFIAFSATGTAIIATIHIYTFVATIFPSIRAAANDIEHLRT